MNRSLFGDMALQFRDAPTLSYTPRDPAELTRAMIAPVGTTALGLMANNGWALDDVLRLMVAEINGLENAPGAQDLVPESVPTPTLFPDAARLAGDLRRQRLVILADIEIPQTVSPAIATDRVDGSDFVQAVSHNLEYKPAPQPETLVLTRSEPGYRLQFSAESRADPRAESLRTLLHLTPGRLEYPVIRQSVPGGLHLRPLPDALDEIDLRTRTLFEMLIFLSKGVEVPADHVERGVAAQTIEPGGTLFDWTLITHGLFHVSVQKKHPKNAAVAIEHHGYWYFIPTPTNAPSPPWRSFRPCSTSSSPSPNRPDHCSRCPSASDPTSQPIGLAASCIMADFRSIVSRRTGTHR